MKQYKEILTQLESGNANYLLTQAAADIIKDLQAEVERLTVQLDLKTRKLAVLSNVHALDVLYAGGLAQEHEITRLTEAIKKTHTAKGRYHSQIAMCDLYDLVGLPNVRPK